MFLCFPQRPLTPRTICGIYLEVKEEGSEVLVQVSFAIILHSHHP